MKLIDDNTLPQVAMAFMNQVHAEDIAIINELHTLLLSCEEDQSEENITAVDTQFESWYEHTLDHFTGEETKMLELNFPPYPMHKAEHEKALIKMETVYRDWTEKRDITALKTYIRDEIPSWLDNHIRTMDTVTAMFFKQQLG